MADYAPANLLDMMAASKEAGLYGGLLGLGSALLQAGAPSTTPGGGLSALAQGGQAFMRGNQMGRQSVMGDAQANMAMAEMVRQQQQRQKMEQYVSNAFGPSPALANGKGPTVGNASALDAGNAALPPGVSREMMAALPPEQVIKLMTDRAAKIAEYQDKVKYEPQIAGATEAARNAPLLAREGGMKGLDLNYQAALNPIMSQRAGMEANARLPSQMSLAGYNSQLDVNTAGPKAFNAAMAQQRAGLSPVDVGGGRVMPAQQATPYLAELGKAFGAAQPVQMGGQSIPAGQVAEVGKTQVKNRQGAQNVLSILDQIEPMVMDEKTGQMVPDMSRSLLERATGSGIGAGVDWAAQMVGASTGGADAIARLKPYSAALMMAMPRMEGPQSDKDVAMYQEAAGAIGDPTVPASQKRQAMQSLRELQMRYAPQQTDGWSITPVGGQ